MVHNPNKGFTLLELLISLTILAVIVVIIFGALRIGVRAWEKGERDIEIHQRRRIVLDLIKCQLASICLNDIRNGGKEPFLLKGDDKSVEFVSLVPMVPGNEFGMVYVRYEVRQDDTEEKERLAFYEKNIVLLEKNAGQDESEKDADQVELDEDAFYELIPGVQSIAFEYLKYQSEEEAYEWQETWDPENDEGFPGAVRIILQEDAEAAPICVIARIEKDAGQ
ncbi:MAG: prepilin-type N-terminal cleavage/methylation domain-containing protein [Desulfobacterales bacterium]|nr:prepilin-type N-terminal cleavage/methylation domain-containing protein [Desulfobacterales bacterium]